MDILAKCSCKISGTCLKDAKYYSVYVNYDFIGYMTIVVPCALGKYIELPSVVQIQYTRRYPWTGIACILYEHVYILQLEAVIQPIYN